MTDRRDDSVPSPPGGDVTTETFLARVPEARLLRLRVVEIHDVGTASRIIRLTGDDLAGFSYDVGQDLMVLAAESGGRAIRRRYTIRRFDPIERVLDLRVVTDTGGPGARWALRLRPGAEVEAIGPRGKITLAAGMTSHVFVGDDVSLPAIAAMVEALPAGHTATAVVEVAHAADEMKIDLGSGVDLSWRWLHRGDRPAGAPEPLLTTVAETPIPPGAHAYVFGEASVVAAVATALADRGIAGISPKAYWGRGRANASHGEPLKR